MTDAADDQVVVPVDFGLQKREVGRMLARLIGIAEEHEAAVMADPVRFWKLAQMEMQKLVDDVRAAQDALYDETLVRVAQISDTPPPLPRCVMVDEAEYMRWRKAVNMLRAIDTYPKAGS